MLKRLLSWLFLAALLYYAASAVQSPAPMVPLTTEAEAPLTTAEKYPALRKATDIERWKRALNPDYAAAKKGAAK